MPESVRRLAEEVEQLKEGTLVLSGQVSNLSGALSTLNHLQAEQVALRKKVDAAVVDPQDIADRVEEAGAPVRADVRATRRLARGLICVVVVVAVLGFLGFSSYVQYRNDTSKRCLDRNTQSTIVRDAIDKSLREQATKFHLTKAQQAEAQAQADQFKKAFPISPTCKNLRFHLLGWYP